MKGWFFQNPETLHIDSTYKVNLENYLLCNFLVQYKRLKGLSVAFALMRQETNENYNFVFKNVFDVLDASLDKIIGWLTNLDLLRDAIPTADLLICELELLPWMLLKW
jgi:hypothetical protein